MKKLNRKQRALKEIRLHNAIAKGKTLKYAVKVSDTAFNESPPYTSILLDEYMKGVRQPKKLKRKFDISLVGYKSGKESDDYIKGLTTIVFEFKYKRK